jgi:hypothetical protein
MLRLVQALEAESWFAALPKHIGTDDIIIRLESREQGEQVLEQLRYSSASCLFQVWGLDV